MNLPRPYFSYSQLKLWESSPKSYYKKYVLNESQYNTKEQNFGKKFMEDLEFDESIPLDEYNLRKFFPTFDIIEEDITVPISPEININLFGYIDSIKKDYSAFIEYKTGRVKWTQELVDKDLQLEFYATMIYLKTGKIPTAELIWLETYLKDDKTVAFTGKIERFKRTFNDVTIYNTLKRIKKAISEILEYEYEEYSISDDKAMELFKLTQEKKEIELKIDAIKTEILIDMETEGFRYGQSGYGSFSVATRKKYKYSDDVKAIERTLKKVKKEEEENGIAEKTETKYLIFKPIDYGINQD